MTFLSCVATTSTRLPSRSTQDGCGGAGTAADIGSTTAGSVGAAAGIGTTAGVSAAAGIGAAGGVGTAAGAGRTADTDDHTDE